MPQNGRFWRVFENLKLAVLPDRSILIRQKLVENAKIQKFKRNILSDFQTLCEVQKGTFGQFKVPPANALY